MSKIWEKKNLGIPVTLLVLMAYFIGYSFMFNLYNLLVAFVFGGFVFVLDFDERVKTAIKQSYTISILFSLVNILILIFNHLYMMFNTHQDVYYSSSDITKNLSVREIFYNIYNFSNEFLNIVGVIVFAIFIITTIMKKEIKLNFILNILGEGTPKQPKSEFNQSPSMQQQAFIQQQTYMQQQIPPVGSQTVMGSVCPVCGAPVKEGASFCNICGNKLK